MMMKKFVALVILFILMAGAVNAQSILKGGKVRYQGEVDLGYSIGVGTFGAGRINLHTIQGAKFGRYFSAGLGLGLDYYHSGSHLILPAYLNLKGYYPVSPKVSPYLSFDIGVGVGISSALSGLSGVYCTPAVGIRAGHFKAQLGFNIQRLSEMGIGFNFNAVQLKVGVIF